MEQLIFSTKNILQSQGYGNYIHHLNIFIVNNIKYYPCFIEIKNNNYVGVGALGSNNPNNIILKLNEQKFNNPSIKINDDYLNQYPYRMNIYIKKELTENINEYNKVLTEILKSYKNKLIIGGLYSDKELDELILTKSNYRLLKIIHAILKHGDSEYKLKRVRNNNRQSRRNSSFISNGYIYKSNKHQKNIILLDTSSSISIKTLSSVKSTINNLSNHIEYYGEYTSHLTYFDYDINPVNKISRGNTSLANAMETLNENYSFKNKHFIIISDFIDKSLNKDILSKNIFKQNNFTFITNKINLQPELSSFTKDLHNIKYKAVAI